MEDIKKRFLVRGKTEQNNEWVEGYLYTEDINIEREQEDIIPIHVSCDGVSYYTPQFIKAETFGYYTRFKDKNGRRIYEDDVLAFDDNCGVLLNYLVYWNPDRCFIKMLEFGVNPDDLDEEFCKCAKVIGNIYDNPELLEE